MQARTITIRISSSEFATLSAHAAGKKTSATRYATSLVKSGLQGQMEEDRLAALEAKLTQVVREEVARVTDCVREVRMGADRLGLRSDRDFIAMPDPVEDMAIWLMVSWPMQRWGFVHAASGAALRDWRAALADMTVSQINRAIASCETMSSPPDPVKFNGAGMETV